VSELIFKKLLPIYFYTDFTQTAWLVVQNKVTNGSVTFKQKWSAYSSGFGNPNASDNYWIGNKALNQLTSTKPGILMIKVK
jgi:hypothetical protein